MQDKPIFSLHDDHRISAEAGGSPLRAGLLSEFWSLCSKKSGQDAWTRNVTRCHYVNHLAKPLVGLVDAVHPLAFNDDWFQLSTCCSGRATCDRHNQCSTCLA